MRLLMCAALAATCAHSAVAVASETCTFRSDRWEGAVQLRQRRNAAQPFATIEESAARPSAFVMLDLDRGPQQAVEIEGNSIRLHGFVPIAQIDFYPRVPAKLDEWLIDNGAPLHLLSVLPTAEIEATIDQVPNGVSTKRSLRASLRCRDLSLDRVSIAPSPSQKKIAERPRNKPRMVLPEGVEIPLALAPAGPPVARLQLAGALDAEPLMTKDAWTRVYVSHGEFALEGWVPSKALQHTATDASDATPTPATEDPVLTRPPGIHRCFAEVPLFVPSEDGSPNIEVGTLRKNALLVVTGSDGQYAKVRLLAGPWLRPRTADIWRVPSLLMTRCPKE